MKRLVALFLVLAFTFGMTGCSKLKSEVATLNEKVAALQAEVDTKAKELEAAAAEKTAALEAAAVKTAVAETTAELEAAAAAEKATADAKIKELSDAITEKDEAIQRLLQDVKATDVVVLYTGDVHCGVSVNLGYDFVVAVKQALLNAGHTVITVDTGDAVQGDAIGTLSAGECLIDIMNTVGYDVATIGNHEFDYGMEQFKSNVERARFPYVCCNFVDADGKSVFDSYKIIEAGGHRIAFVGIDTPTTMNASTPTNFMDDQGKFIYSFRQDPTGEKLYKTVQAAVDDARAAGADIVIALGHLGIDTECSPWTSREVIAKTSGIDVFLDGHSHDVIPCEEAQNAEGKIVLLTSTGTKLTHVGCLTIAPDGTLKTSLISDNGAEKIINDTVAPYAELMQTVVAHTDFNLCINDPVTGKRIVYTRETNLGDFCADAYRTMSGADIGIINGGGVRADVPAGDITYGRIFAIHPFCNMLSMVECTGEEIWQALELGACKLPVEFGGFLHVSKNVKYTIDLSVPSPVVLDDAGLFVKLEGDHRVTSVTINGEPLNPAKTYSLACHDFLLKNMGDGYTMFMDNNYLPNSVMIDNQVLINYIVDVLGGSIGAEYANPYGDGRITIISAVETATEQPAA